MRLKSVLAFLFALALLASPVFAQVQCTSPCKWLYRNPSGDYIEDVDLTTDGRAVVGTRNGLVVVLDANGNKLREVDLTRIVGKSFGIKFVAVTGDGSYIAAGTSDRILYMLRDGELLWKQLISTDAPIKDITMAKNGNYVVASTWETLDKIIIYDVATGRQTATTKMLHTIGSLDITPNGKMIAVATQQSGLMLFDEFLNPKWVYLDGTSGFRIAGFSGQSVAPFFRAAISSDGDVLLGSTEYGNYYFVKNNRPLDRPDQIARLTTDAWTGTRNYDVSAVDLSYSGTYAVVAGNSGDEKNPDLKALVGGRIYFLKEYDVRKGWRFDADKWIAGAAISQNGKYVAAASGPAVYFFENTGITLDEPSAPPTTVPPTTAAPTTMPPTAAPPTTAPPTTVPPATAPPATPEPEKKGICGPGVLVVIAALAALARWKKTA